MNINSINFPNFPEAQCTQGATDFFFPDSNEELKERLTVLRSICHSCIHRADCAEFAIEEAITGGFWGGLTENERASIIRQRGKHFDKRHRTIAEILQKKSHGWSIETIAKSMGLSVIAVKDNLERGKQKGIINE